MNATCEEVATRILGPPRKRVGAELYWLCPIHEDRSPSLQINPKKDAFFCGPCSKAGNAWRLVAFLNRFDPGDKRAIVGWLEGNGMKNGAGPPAATHKTSKPKVSDSDPVAYFYYGENLRKVRLEGLNAEGIKSKTFQWQHLAGENWIPGGGGLPVPLYANECFRSKEKVPVLGFEGEGKVDCAQKLGIPAFSFKNLTGEQASLLADHDIVLWPDKDPAGRIQANDARQVIRQYGHVKSLRIIIPPSELPISGDIVDAVRDLKFGVPEIFDLIEAARDEAAGEVPVGKLLSEVLPQKIEWLWSGRIPLGAITILDGDPGCLHGDTPIYDPVNKTLVSIRQRFLDGTTFHVYSMDLDGNVVIATAESPKRFPAVPEMLQFSIEDHSITVTKGHRFWTEAGWQTASDITSEPQSGFSPFLLGTNLDTFRTIHAEDVLHYFRITPDSQAGYRSDLHSYDGPVPLFGDGAQECTPLPSGVQRHNHPL